MPQVATREIDAPTVPNSPMTLPALAWRIIVTVPRVLLLGKRGWVSDEQLTAEQICDRYRQNPLAPGLNPSLRLIGMCLSRTADADGIDVVAALKLLEKQPRHTGDTEHDCVLSDAVSLMKDLLPQQG